MNGHTYRIAGTALLAAAAFAALAQPSSPPIVVTHEYDASGNPTRRIVAPGVLGITTTTEYDRLQRTSRITDARGARIELGYVGGTTPLAHVLDPRSLLTRYDRTGLGDLAVLTSPDTGQATQAVDAAGNVVSRTDSRGVTAQLSYDALNRLTAVTYSAGGQQVSYAWRYDETGAGFTHGIGRLTSALHPRGWSAFAYDAEGRVTTHTQQVTDHAGASALTTTVHYVYDAAGNPVQMVYPSGRVLGITYAAGRPVAMSLAENAAATPLPLVSQIGFDPRGAVTGWLWHLDSGTQAHPRSIDLSGRPVRYRLGPWQRDLAYDAAGRITGYTHSDAVTGQPAPGLDQSFGYDELGRITSVVAGSLNWNYGYDANGNRTAVVHNGYGNTYTVSLTSNRLLATAYTIYSHDAAGSVTAANALFFSSPPQNRTASYDLRGRLESLQGPYLRGDYVVDAFGRRVLKTVSSSLAAGGYYAGAPPAPTVTVFAYDEAGQLIGEYDGATGSAVREYVWLGATPIAVVVPGAPGGPAQVLLVHADHLDTPRVAVDRSNRLRWTWLSEPFGTTAPNENPGGLGALEFNLRFPGQYFDRESGWHYNYFRDYEPGTGRYVQSDPIGLVGGINTYAYVGSNPLNAVDLLGLFAPGHHVHMTQNVARRLCPKLMQYLPNMVAQVDWQPGSQSPANAFRHGMSDGQANQSANDAQVVTDRFIDREVRKCTAAGLANALHAEQDKHSAPHTGFAPWSGGSPSASHVWGDTVGALGGPFGRAEAATEQLIRRFKTLCPCVCD